MTVRVFDGAYKPNLQAVVAAGGVAMSVYLTGRYSTTCAQPSELHALGLGALGNYEEAPGELLTCGYSGGVTIGQRSAGAYIAKGAPVGQRLGVAYSVDVNCPLSAFAAVGDAFDGIKTGLAGRFTTHVYGEGALIDYLVESGRVTGRQWLSGSTSFPGWNPNDPNVGLIQRTWSPVPGTDLDDVTDLSTLGIWWPNGVTPQGGGTPITEDILTLEEHNALMTLLNIAQTGRIDGDRTQWPYPYTPAAATLGAVQANAAAIAATANAVTADQSAVLAAVGKVQAATVDVATLAGQLATALGPDLSKQLVGALGAAITKGNS
jgi:hypothetical protein